MLGTLRFLTTFHRMLGLLLLHTRVSRVTSMALRVSSSSSSSVQPVSTFPSLGASSPLLPPTSTILTPTTTTTNMVETIDLHHYLDRIEALLRHSSSDDKEASHQTLAQSSSTKTATSTRKRIVRRKLTEPNRKPMIRTLLGFDYKVEFDKVVRDAQKSLEYQRMTNFCRDILLPMLLANEDEDSTNHGQDTKLNNGNTEPKNISSSSLWKQRVPDLAERVRVALNEPPSSYSVRDGTFPFRKLSTGRLYKGKTLDMIQDLFPYSYVVEAFAEASTPPSETEVLQAVVESRRPWLQSKSSSNISNDSSQQLLQVALQLCVCRFPTSNDDDEVVDTPCPTKSGQDCERACLAFLKEQAPQDHVVLQNVFVKAGTSSPKNGSASYHNHHNKKNSHHNLKRRRNGIVSGTIWTRVLRDNICSEFDIVIVDPRTKRVVEVWEAKRSISPSTLWDAMDRKLSAVQQLVKDKDAILEYDGVVVGENNEDCNLAGNDNPLSEMAEPTIATAWMVDDSHNDDHNSQDCDTAQPKMVFGMFGTELLAPQNAVGQLEAIAAGKALSSSVETVLKAVQCGYVEIDRARLLFDIHVLRAKLHGQAQQFTIVLKIGNTLPSRSSLSSQSMPPL